MSLLCFVTGGLTSEQKIRKTSMDDKILQSPSSQNTTSATKSIRMMKTSVLPVIDGVLDDECWHAVKEEQFLVNADGSVPKERTEFKAAYDDVNLYLCFRCYESKTVLMKKRYHEHDALNIFEDDCVELFISPDGKGYYYIVINSFGTYTDKYLKDITWESNSRIAVKMGDKHWDVEVAIPFASFAITPGVSNVWTANFCREEQRLPEYTAWSPTGGGFHQIGKFGKLWNLELEGSTFRELLYAEAIRRLDKLKKGLSGFSANLSTEAVARKHEELHRHLTLLFAGISDASGKNSDDKAWQVLWEQLEGVERKMGVFQCLCRAYDFYGKGVGKEAALDYAVGIVPSTEKIFKYEPFAGDFTNSVRLSAARGEVEGFQLVFVPLEKDMEDIKIECSDLLGANGKIDRQDIVLSKVGYVETRPPTLYTVEKYVKFWPDPLMPLRGFDAPILSVEKGTVQPIYVAIKVPEGSSAGSYEGKITVKPENCCSAVVVKISLNVWNFAIPEKSHLRVVQWLSLSYLRFFYFGGQPVPMNFVDPFLEFLLEHKITPVLFLFDCANIYIEKSGNYSFDFTPLKRFLLAYCREKRIDIIEPELPARLDSNDEIGVYDKKSGRRTTVKAKDIAIPYLKALDNFLKSDGWLDKVEAIYLVWDEPGAKDDFAKIAEMGKNFKRFASHLKILQTTNVKFPIAELEELVDIWVPEITSFDKEAAERLVKKGKTVWWYSANADRHPFPGIYIDYPALDCRIIPWMSWKLGISGWLHCSANHWGYSNSNFEVDPRKRWPNKTWSASWYAENDSRISNETGWVYPGSDGPLSSIRLESFRDGLEDYEYFYLLNEKLDELKEIGEGKDHISGGQVKALIKEIENTLKIDDDIVKNNRAYTKDVGKLLDYREKIARHIEAADKILNQDRHESR